MTRRSAHAVVRAVCLSVCALVLSAVLPAVPAGAAPLPSRRSAPAATTATVQPAAGQYYPARTRVLTGLTILAKTTISVRVTGLPGIPRTGVEAVALNVAVGGNAGSGGLIVYPSGSPQPAVTGARYQAGVFNHELLVVQVGADGFIKIANIGSVSAIIYADLHGYFLADPGVSPGSTYVPLDTARIASNVSIPANSTHSLAPLGSGGIPTSGVTAVAFSLVAQSTAAGKLNEYPSGTAPTADTVLDYRANALMSNMVFGALGDDGTLVIANSGSSPVTISVDVTGYFAAPGSAVAGSVVVPRTPVRTVSGASVPANGSLTLSPLGSAGVPASGVAAVGLNITVTSAGSGSLRVHPSGQPNPPAGGSITYLAADEYAQYVPAKVGADGRIVIVNAGASAATVWVDVFGYFSASTEPAAPPEVTATPGDGQMTVTWTAPADGGAAITAYHVIPSSDSDPVQVDGDHTSAVITGLTNGRFYTFTVTATNAVGTGPESAASAPAAPQAATTPTARFTVNCDQATRSCQFDGSTSTSPGGTITNYEWSFGDGAVAAGPVTSHTYSDGGTHLVVLTVTDDVGESGSSTHEVVLRRAPTARFTTSCVNSTLTCTFDASGSEAPDGTITRYAWDFGDGTAGSGPSASHRFVAGTYSVTVAVSDSNGLSATAGRSLTIGSVNAPPIARITPTCDDSALFCGFDGTASADPDGDIASYLWDFGDGATSTLAAQPHIYAQPGTYTVRLTVTDNQGAVGTATTQVEVSGSTGGSLEARYSFLCLIALTCDFDATSSSGSDGDIVTYQWDFGDGTTGSGPVVSHVYPRAGAFTATLTVTDDRGHTASISNEVKPH